MWHRLQCTAYSRLCVSIPKCVITKNKATSKDDVTVKNPISDAITSGSFRIITFLNNVQY